MIMTKSRFNTNYANNDAGGFYVKMPGQGTMTFTECESNNNYATDSGGFIFFENVAGCSSEINLIKSIQNTNSANTNHGGYAYQLCPNTNTLKINT